MTKKSYWMTAGLAVLLVGGTTTYFVSQDDTAIEVQKVDKMSEEKQQAFLDDLLMKVSDGEKPSEIEKMLAEKVGGLNKDNASEAVYILLNALSIEQGVQMDAYKVLGDGVIKAYNDNQFKSGADETYSKVEDKSVQGYLQELTRQFLFVEDDGEGLYLSQNLKPIEKKYGDYINEALKGVLDVRLKNQENPYVDAERTSYDMDAMMERILFIEDKKESWQLTIYEGEMLALQEQAYMDFFGVTHETYFNESNGKLVMKKDIVEKFESLYNEYPNTFMGADIYGFLDELDGDKYEKKDTQGFIYDKLVERFALDSLVQAPIVTEGEGVAE